MLIETTGILGPSVKRLLPTVYVLYTKICTYVYTNENMYECMLHMYIQT